MKYLSDSYFSFLIDYEQAVVLHENKNEICELYFEGHC